MKLIRLFAVALLATASLAARAADVDPAIQAKIDTAVQEIKTWAADPAIVDAVVAHNAELPADQAAMTQDKWKSLTLLDPFVRGFSKNPAGTFLKSKKAAWVAEAFLSDAKGFKVAFLAKTTSWCHAGAAKHDQPMAGKTWEGALTLDESTGIQQIQVSVPVEKDGHPIGSLVVGIVPAKL